MKILSASVKVIDEKNHVRFLTLADVDITIKGATPSPIAEIPEIQEAPREVKKPEKRKKNR